MRIIRLLTVITICLVSLGSHAALVTVDPSTFPSSGTDVDITNAYSGVTLSATIIMANGGGNFTAYEGESIYSRSLGLTNDYAFGWKFLGSDTPVFRPLLPSANGGSLAATFRADFDVLTDFVSLTTLATTGHINNSVLRAYDAQGNQVGTAAVPSGTQGQYILSITHQMRILHI